MELNYQVIIDSIASIMLVACPIGIALLVSEKLINIFYSFLFGKRVNL